MTMLGALILWWDRRISRFDFDFFFFGTAIIKLSSLSLYPAAAGGCWNTGKLEQYMPAPPMAGKKFQGL
jgi:hypothetical protein